MELCTPILCRPSCNLFVEDPLEDSEILHSGEGGDVERWLKPRHKFFVFAIAYVLLSIAFHYSYLYGCSSCILLLFSFHPSLSLSVYTHFNKEAIEHLNLLFIGNKEEI